MEFNEKLQELRKKKGLTQEELAEKLFVSRTAVSKWESGRGFPNIDSLKEIARFFGVTIDDLLSSDELLTVAEEDTRQNEKRFRDTVFGLLDISVAMLFFLPIFGQKVSGGVREVSLLELGGISVYLKTTYIILVSLLVISGVLTIALQNSENSLWIKSKSKLSLALTAVGTVLFVVSLQPYAATMLLSFLLIKGLLLIKRR